MTIVETGALFDSLYAVRGVYCESLGFHVLLLSQVKTTLLSIPGPAQDSTDIPPSSGESKPQVLQRYCSDGQK
jgi:hypothetical protein